MRILTLSIGGCILLSFLTPGSAAAQHDWHSSEQQAMLDPTSRTDLSMHPGWRVYRHERDDTAYIHVSDESGMQQLIVGSSLGSLAASLMGSESMAISLPSSPLSVPASAAGELIYTGSEFSLMLHVDGATSIWSVLPPQAEPEG